MTEQQTERAFQRQATVFQGRFLAAAGKTRHFKNVGLGFETPREAVEGTYVDRKCPFTGGISIRGRILRGTVKSTKMQRSVVIRRDYLHYVAKYRRYERRHKNLTAHVSPCFRVKEGDTVTVGECRPLSKTIRFNVLRVEPAGEGEKKRFSAF
ncbi:Ribosomal protein S11 [Giardia muris]|uniref:Ribosomal protein S11 n=1 Tax=Giardia muris TaxID=5742 RepID=A0A4Z1SLM8_GIAMU|nr:Ribosomal protein S11 [Giardia muris]|eukprot:TNJ26566.1 Ribosomal protein S11 [Giardia muris]